jgi:hypothetical protein
MSKTFEDPLSSQSARPGPLGFIESFFRKFRTFGFALFLLPLGLIYLICIGTALSPAVFYVEMANQASAHWSLLARCLLIGLALAGGVISFWMTLLFIVPIFNFPFIFLVKPMRTTWFSLSVIPWYYHNALTQLVRYTTMDFITPTPLTVLFYRMMGMKIGKGVMINTSSISDPCLIQLDDYVTIGGAVTMFAHYGMKGYLVIERVHIQRGSTIGLRASIMGDVVVGENVTVPPHTIVLPKSRIEESKVKIS